MMSVRRLVKGAEGDDATGFQGRSMVNSLGREDAWNRPGACPLAGDTSPTKGQSLPMRTGISLLLWTTDPADEKWLPLFGQLAALGYDGVELPIYDLDPRRWSALGRRLDGLGLARTGGTALGPDTDPASADPGVRARATDRLRAVVDCCQ